MNHYVYMMSINANTEKELFYIGVRSCEIDPIDDQNYLGSSQLLNHLIINGLTFQKDILEICPTRKAANDLEQLLIAESINNYACLNLKHMDMDYEPLMRHYKMRHIQKYYPETMPHSGSMKKVYRELNANDLKYCVGEWHYLKFIDHPEMLKYFYPKTGTRVFWPGRTDKLMSIKKGQSKYYQTAVELVQGSPQEQIRELITNHLVPGQRFNILDHCLDLLKLTKNDIDIINLIESTIESDRGFNSLKYHFDKIKKMLLKDIKNEKKKLSTKTP